MTDDNPPRQRGRPPIPVKMDKFMVTLDADTVSTLRQLAERETGALNLSAGIRIAARIAAPAKTRAKA